ncbi:DNA polymerase Y family protein [Ciceribacter sp. L1K23]|nr:DNA polymerase Y family protein [Ciceribacter sp. L1K23]
MNVALPTCHPLSSSDRRILSISFPRLATDRIARGKWGASWRSTGRPDAPPIVCSGQVGNARQLTAIDTLAEGIGLRIGQGLAEARAIRPDLDVSEADAEADQRLLDALANWCDRYTPLVALDGRDGLLLDITGCAHLFGGEAKMLDDVLARLRSMGLDAKGAISSTAGLSWALSRFGAVRVVEQRDTQAALTSLPVASLRLDGEVVAGLVRMGLKQVGDLIDLPRAPLARRFGAAVLLRLDQALGRVGEPISPRRSLAMLSVERHLVEPIRDRDMILDLAEGLAAGLKPGLEARGEGGRLFELLLFRVDGRVFRIEVGTAAPLREPKRIAALYRERLEVAADDMDAGFGFEFVRLNVLASEAFRDGMPQLLTEQSAPNDSLPDFIDLVSARLGPGCLKVPVSLASHWPERASGAVSLTDHVQSVGSPVDAPARLERPLRLLSRAEPVTVLAEIPHGPPASFQWRRIRHRVVRSEGPERLTPEWWLEDANTSERDYFRVEDAEGRRYWIYRQGLYERGATDPGWFMQGIFA